MPNREDSDDPPQHQKGKHPLPGLEAELKEGRDAFTVVPEIGKGRRWYDAMFRVLSWLQSGWRNRILPRPVVTWLSRQTNNLHAISEHARNIVWARDSPTANLAIPADEHVKLPMIWVVELFPPTHTRALNEALSRRGWVKRRPNVPYESNNREELLQARSGGGLHWWRLAEVTREKTRGSRPPLPSEFEYAEVRAVQVGPSLTAVVAAFGLTDAGMAALDEEWHRGQEPRLIRQRGMMRPLDRKWATFWNVQTERKRIHSSARTWLRSHLPGFFSHSGEPQPLLDLMLLDSFDPTSLSIVEDVDKERASYEALRALGIPEPLVNQLVSDQLPHLVLGPPDPILHEVFGQDPTWTLWGSRPAFVLSVGENSLKPYGAAEDINRAIARRIGGGPHHLLIMIAISEFLRTTEAKYALLRDNALSQHGRYGPKALETLRQTFLNDSLNLLVVYRDAASFAKSARGRRNIDFESRETPGQRTRSGQKNEMPQPTSFLETLALEHEDRFQALHQADRGYRELFATVASLGASADSYRISRLALWVAFASVGAALATFGLEIMPVEALDSFWEWASSRFNGDK